MIYQKANKEPEIANQSLCLIYQGGDAVSPWMKIISFFHIMLLIDSISGALVARLTTTIITRVANHPIPPIYRNGIVSENANPQTSNMGLTTINAVKAPGAFALFQRIETINTHAMGVPT